MSTADGNIDITTESNPNEAIETNSVEMLANNPETSEMIHFP